MSELMTPGGSETTSGMLYLIDDAGREIAVPPGGMWAHRPDAWYGHTQILDMADLPREEWMNQGDNDE